MRMAEHESRFADQMAMVHSLKLRAPIMDRDVIRFAARIPVEYKIQAGRLKMLLLELCRKYYPDDFVDRRKCGFGLPMARWFAGPLAGLVQQVINQGEIFQSRIFRPQHAQELFDEHRNRRTDHNFKIRNIINLEVQHCLFVTRHGRHDVRDWLKHSSCGQNSDQMNRGDRK